MIVKKRVNEDKANKAELILEVGTEGGSLMIHRFRASDGLWKFTFITNEAAMADFLDVDDQIDLVKKYPQVDTFEEALQLMGKYSWHEMHILTINQEYAEVIQAEKQKRLAGTKKSKPRILKLF